jgi:tetratricopeptide (TPR) repeat protein
LLKNGANYNARSRYGDDALQMACLKGAARIFDYLTINICYASDKLANAHELMGATFLEEHNDAVVALFHWREGLACRQSHGLLPKLPIREPKEGYRFQKEFETMEELDNIATDLDLIRTQSLIIAERILGPHHKDTIFRLMYRGAAYADMLRYQRCIDLWRRALEIRVEKDSILYTDTCFTAQALVRQMVDYNEKSAPKNEKDARQRFHDVVCTFKLITKDILGQLFVVPCWLFQDLCFFFRNKTTVNYKTRVQAPSRLLRQDPEVRDPLNLSDGGNGENQRAGRDSGAINRQPGAAGPAERPHRRLPLALVRLEVQHDPIQLLRGRRHHRKSTRCGFSSLTQLSPR